MRVWSPGAPRSWTSLPQTGCGFFPVRGGGPRKGVLHQHHLLTRANFKSIRTSLPQFHIWEIPSHIRQDKGTETHRQERLLRHGSKGRACGQELSVHRWDTGETDHLSIHTVGDRPAGRPAHLCHGNRPTPPAAFSSGDSSLATVYFWSQTLDHDVPRTKCHPCFEDGYPGTDTERCSGCRAKEQRSPARCVSQSSDSKQRAHPKVCRGV